MDTLRSECELKGLAFFTGRNLLLIRSVASAS